MNGESPGSFAFGLGGLSLSNKAALALLAAVGITSYFAYKLDRKRPKVYISVPPMMEMGMEGRNQRILEDEEYHAYNARYTMYHMMGGKYR
jgi:hypothetical protein